MKLLTDVKLSEGVTNQEITWLVCKLQTSQIKSKNFLIYCLLIKLDKNFMAIGQVFSEILGEYPSDAIKLSKRADAINRYHIQHDL